jgi:molybdopterin-containing oxidoreductase family iron-sulfur binding subunit
MVSSQPDGDTGDELSSKDTKPELKDVNYWRSFSELYNDPAFIKARNNEFSDEASKPMDVSRMPGLTRRRFLALLSASAALAAAGCSNYRDKGLVVPYNQKPEEVVLGIPNYYASTCTGCSSACGILVKTREGRPIKVDGNPDHPVNMGKICTKGQASVINLYDPTRLQNPLFSSGRNNHSQTTWEEAYKNIAAALGSANSSGKEIAVIANTITSPTLKKLFDDFKTTYPTAKLYSYELFNNNARKSAWMKSYNKKSLPVLELNKAKVILALESDFLGNDENAIEYTRMFSESRNVMGKEEFSRLYSVEGAMSLTGMSADYRIRLRTDAIEGLVHYLLGSVIKTGDTRVTGSLQSIDPKQYNINEKVLNRLVDDLKSNRGKSIVIAGDKLPESTHIAVNLLNETLEANKLYSSEAENVEAIPLSTPEEIDALINNMNADKVGVVVHFDSNPVFHFSTDYNYAEALKKVQTVVSLTELINESANISNYILPINNQLESWGDHKTRTGFYSMQQPVIAPLYNTRQKEAILLGLTKPAEPYNDKVYHDYLMKNWETVMYPSMGTMAPFQKTWFAALHDGIAYVNEKTETAGSSFSADAFVSSTGKMKPGSDYVLLLQGNNTVGDGRFANNGWLMELPNPVTKIVWDNYAAVSVQTAADLGLNSNDLIEITAGNKKQTFPVFVQPGLADKVIEIALGYGRTVCGVVGQGVGVNAGVLISKNPSISERLYNNVQVSKSSGTYELISTQEHFPIDDNPLLKDMQFKRGVIREGLYEEYKKNPEFLKEELEKEKLNLAPINKTHPYETPEYKGVKWGMSIDLNKCTGCGSCIVACSVENNIPVVGKDQVKANREMMWIRIDRYYSGTPDSPRTNLQPMLCQHCDFAPCENVCPVVATTHSPEGLNIMTYNRCVGTRYCSNNCPYKVRRFNYFDFRDHFNDSIQYADSLSLLMNPEVTVRSRGVMEKCTFCLQRIMYERQNAIEEKRGTKGSNVKTACQEACPAYAIEFGDVNEEGSEVQKWRNHELGYKVLEEIKVQPNITYIARLRNISEEYNKEEHKTEK